MNTKDEASLRGFLNRNATQNQKWIVDMFLTSREQIKKQFFHLAIRIRNMLCVYIFTVYWLYMYVLN